MNTNICDSCGAIGESCCQKSKANHETAKTLAAIVWRQVDTIKELRARLGETETEVKDGESDYKWGDGQRGFA